MEKEANKITQELRKKVKQCVDQAGGKDQTILKLIGKATKDFNEGVKAAMKKMNEGFLAHLEQNLMTKEREKAT